MRVFNFEDTLAHVILSTAPVILSEAKNLASAQDKLREGSGLSAGVG
jgi:hypothetical protein